MGQPWAQQSSRLKAFLLAPLACLGLERRTLLFPFFAIKIQDCGRVIRNFIVFLFPLLDHRMAVHQPDCSLSERGLLPGILKCYIFVFAMIAFVVVRVQLSVKDSHDFLEISIVRLERIPPSPTDSCIAGV